MIGRNVAHYSVIGELGAGGMGQVWRARDSKLGRDVALKVLPAMFAESPERLARFKREAQVLASLNHPNIGSIYGIEALDGSFALVLELVEGPTLDDRLKGGPLPVDEALEVARQVADALEAAHDKGIVHRDLKPANVKLTADGRVKVLDFGLAKALADEASGQPSGTGGDELNSPTISPAVTSPVLTSPLVTGAMTAPNVLLGTAAYMSPEQARGYPADERADVWAFGVLVFEMLTGRRLFAGETLSDTIASVLKHDPDFSLLPAGTPPRVVRMLRRCLRRKRAFRLRHIADARLAILEHQQGIDPETAAEAAVAEGGTKSGSRPWLPAAAGVVAGAALAAIVVPLVRQQAPPAVAEKRTYVMELPPGEDVSDLALAPDGSALAFVTGGQLLVRDFATGEDRVLAEASELHAPFWSPDGEWVAFGTPDALDRVRRTGGQPVRIAALNSDQRLSTVSAGVWDEAGRIRFTSGSSGLFEVSAQGGDPALIASPGEDEIDFHELTALPDGRGWFVVAHRIRATFDRIDLVHPDGTRTQVLFQEDHELRDLDWSPSGHLMYRRGGAGAGLWALPFDLATMEAAGDPILVVPDALHSTMSRSGTLAYRLGSGGSATNLAVVDRTGKVLKEIGPPATHWPYPRLSPDGRSVVIRILDGDTRNLWKYDLERGTRSRFTQGQGRQDWGAWSPDGSRFWWSDGLSRGEGVLHVRAGNGAGEGQEVVEGLTPSPTADNRYLMFGKKKEDAWDFDIFLLDLTREDAEPVPLIQSEDPFEYLQEPSPVDPIFAYNSGVTGREEVYIAEYPDPQQTWLVSTSGGSAPHWRGDGRELYYAKGDSILAVGVERVPDGVRLTTPSLLFRRPRYQKAGGSDADGFDVTQDGQTFVFPVVTEDSERSVQRIVLVTDWAASMPR